MNIIFFVRQMVYFLLYIYYTLYYTVLIFLLRQKYATYCAISQTFLPRFLPTPLSKIAKIPEIVSGIVNESGASTQNRTTN